MICGLGSVCVCVSTKEAWKEIVKEEALVTLEEAQANTPSSIKQKLEVKKLLNVGEKMKVQKYIVTNSFFSARK